MNNQNKDAHLTVAVLANSGFDKSVGLTNQCLDDKYLTAILLGCGAVPIIVPTLLEPHQLDVILDLVDGVMLTGDVSNIEPKHYGLSGSEKSHGPFDQKRDKAAFHLINAAQRRKIPILGLCRGMQEINVAMGGTLRADFVGRDGFPDHCAIEKSSEPDCIYKNSHHVTVNLKSDLGSAIGKSRVLVNSVHVQAVGKLAEGLSSVAVSDDGLIEAFEDSKHRNMFGVQWHPEYRAEDSPVSMAVFGHFSRIMRASRRIE